MSKGHGKNEWIYCTTELGDQSALWQPLGSSSTTLTELSVQVITSSTYELMEALELVLYLTVIHCPLFFLSEGLEVSRREN